MDGDAPTTTDLPEDRVDSATLKHFSLLPRVSWLICSYPFGSKYRLKKEVLPDALLSDRAGVVGVVACASPRSCERQPVGDET